MTGLGILFWTMFLPVTAFGHVKSITPHLDELLQVKTAIGIATIIQVPEPITSAIIGDQSAFKVEYIDKAVTIKPLRPGARTNLYLITSKERFNLTLVPSRQDLADYVVYIKDKHVVPRVKWQDFVRVTKSEKFSLKITRIGISSDGFILVDGVISSSLNQTIRPEDFWIYQGKESKTINSLFISSRSVKKDKPVVLGLSFSKADINKKLPVTITLKGEESISIQIPDTIWK